MTKNSIEPPIELLDNVLCRIKKKELCLVAWRGALFLCIMIATAIFLTPAFKMLTEDINQSGFFYFVSLLFSDFSVIASYWKNFTLALLESVPAVSLALFFAVLVLFLESLKYFSRDAKVILKRALPAIKNHAAI